MPYEAELKHKLHESGPEYGWHEPPAFALPSRAHPPPASNHVKNPSTDFWKYSKHNIFKNELLKQRKRVVGAV
jgi:hypothetical protein